MQYTRYLTIVFDRHRVDFDGWPEDVLIKHPKHMNSKERKKVLALFKRRRLTMSRVTDEEYETRRAVREDNVIKPGPRQGRSDAGDLRVRTNPRTMKKLLWPKKILSPRYVDDGDELV